MMKYKIILQSIIFFCLANPGILFAKKDPQYLVIMITKDGCGYCVQQRKILVENGRELDYQINEINITNRPEITQRYNIRVTPTILLITNFTDNYVQLTAGVESVEYIQQRVKTGVDYLKQFEPVTEQYLM